MVTSHFDDTSYKLRLVKCFTEKHVIDIQGCIYTMISNK